MSAWDWVVIALLLVLAKLVWGWLFPRLWK